MQKDKTIFDRVAGLEPVNKDVLAELRPVVEKTTAEIVEAVTERELLSATSFYRELEVESEMRKEKN